MKALVVGGTGFLGLNLIAALQEAGVSVRATRRRSSNTIFARRLGVQLVPADLDDPDSLVQAMDGCDTVFLAAGHYPRYSTDAAAQVAYGVTGMTHALGAARRAGVRRVVYTSSVVTIARPSTGRPARESDGVASVPEGSVYFALKLAMERAVLEAGHSGLEVVVVCPTGCLGPYDHKVGTGSLVVGMATRRQQLYVDGCLNVVDARDVALGHVLAAFYGRPSHRYILGGHNLTAEDLFAAMADRFGVPMPAQKLAVDEALALATAEEAACAPSRRRPQLSREQVETVAFGQFVDSGKAQRELGFRHRPLLATLDASLTWYQHNGYLKSQYPGGSDAVQGAV